MGLCQRKIGFVPFPINNFFHAKFQGTGRFLAARVISTYSRTVSITNLHLRLPLDTIMLLITELLPKIQDLQLARHRPGPAPAVMDLLRTVTLKHILPPAPPLTPRRFQACSLACNLTLRLTSLFNM